MDTTKQEDMILVSALVGFSHDYEVADEQLADTAWSLAERIAVAHGLTVEQAIFELNTRRD